MLQQLRSETQSLALLVYRELLGRIDLALEEPGLLLPDIIELDQKLHFDQRTVPQLRQSLTSGGFARSSDSLVMAGQGVCGHDARSRSSTGIEGASQSSVPSMGPRSGDASPTA